MSFVTASVKTPKLKLFHVTEPKDQVFSVQWWGLTDYGQTKGAIDSLRPTLLTYITTISGKPTLHIPLAHFTSLLTFLFVFLIKILDIKIQDYFRYEQRFRKYTKKGKNRNADKIESRFDVMVTPLALIASPFACCSRVFSRNCPKQRAWSWAKAIFTLYRIAFRGATKSYPVYKVWTATTRDGTSRLHTSALIGHRAVAGDRKGLVLTKFQSATWMFTSGLVGSRPHSYLLGWFNNRTGTSVDDGKAHGKD